MAKEVTIVKDSMTCFNHEGEQRQLKNADLLNKS